MTRACNDCAMWSKIAAHGRGTQTGYCAHPSQGKVTLGDYSCPFYVRAYGKGFDINVATDAFEKLQAGKAREAAHSRQRFDNVPLAVLRERSRKHGRKVA